MSNWASRNPTTYKEPILHLMINSINGLDNISLTHMDMKVKPLIKLSHTNRCPSAVNNWEETQNPLSPKVASPSTLGTMWISASSRPSSHTLIPYLGPNLSKKTTPRGSKDLGLPPTPPVLASSRGTLTPHLISKETQQ